MVLQTNFEVVTLFKKQRQYFICHGAFICHGVLKWYHHYMVSLNEELFPRKVPLLKTVTKLHHGVCIVTVCADEGTTQHHRVKFGCLFL